MEEPVPEKVNILVVDDLPEKLLVYETMLEDLGQNVVTVSSGEEALKLLLRQEFAVILLDVNMPGMDGFETASLIRRRRKSARTPIIFLTAFTDEMHAQQGYATGAVDYLPTPVVPEILRAKVRVFIELQQMRSQAALQAEERARRTAAEEEARKSAFLARFSELLALSQSRAEIMRTLVELPVSYMADMAMVWLGGEEGEPVNIKWRWQEAWDGMPSTPPFFPSLKKILRRMAAGGHYLLKRDELKEFWPKTLNAPLLESLLVMPLKVRGKTQGALLLGRVREGAYYQPGEVALMYDLVSRASVALENIMLIERIQEADRRKDEFLGMLAHELRNPLGPIRNAVQLMRMMGLKEQRLGEVRDIIDRQVSHMARLIDDLLDATRIARGKIFLRKETCDLTNIVRQTVEDYCNLFAADGIQLELSLPSAPIYLEGDGTRLVQAIGNLLHNAHKFTKKGGKVSVTLARNKKDGTARITIRDTGIGIAAEMLPSVFEVFQQAEQGLDRGQGGLGLGLALVKGLVELHGGRVCAASEGLGKGAEFVIQLPVSQQHQKADAAVVQETAETNGRKYRILVIEDNRDTAESIRLLLGLEGHEVRIAHSGPAGLEAAQDFQPQIVLCDIGLPGMDGYQVARAIRQDSQLSEVYVIALTGYGREEDQEQARHAGFNIHLTKPIDFSMLCNTLTGLQASP
ncbi:MAG: response regulator [Alphaproteobacteria bacterium]|nr:response regulator [Alphaproteobacteria bacterium]